jgi:hypothetical protein
MAGEIEFRVEPAFDPDSRYAPAAGSGEVDQSPQHPLDSDANRALLSQFEDWWTESRDLHATNRNEQIIDADYKDGDQWREEDALVLLERGQAPVSYPLIANMVNWVKGTERRTRVDFNVLPRNDEDVDLASLKKQVLKYVSDVNATGWEMSRAFGDAVDVGVGWVEDCYNRDALEEPLTTRYQDWKGMWWDPYSRSNVLRDCRYLIRGKYLDLDYAQAMFPDRAAALATHAHALSDPALESLELENSLPQMFYNGATAPRAGLNGGTFILSGSTMMSRRTRPRVLALETWYRKPVPVRKMRGGGMYQGRTFDPNNQGMARDVEQEVCSLVDSVEEQLFCAIWTPGLLLAHMPSPYRHNRFPFTPIWGYRRHRDGMPYGLIRLARDAQDEYNKRRSKALYLLSTNQVLYESTSVDEADEDDTLDEAQRPDGRVRLKGGALSNGTNPAFQIRNNEQLASSHVQLMGEAKNNIFELSGVTRENTGQESNAVSGRAILAKQQQGAVTTAEIFDNYRQSRQESGQKQLSNIEQFMSMPKTIRILGPAGATKFVQLNQMKIDEEGQAVDFENDITRSQADYIIDEMDYHETARMAMAEMVMDTLKGLDATIALNLLDIAIDLTDLPNKKAMSNRVRALNGQAAPGQENDPEFLAQKAQRDAAAAERESIADEAARGEARAAHAKAGKLEADTVNANVKGKTDAIHGAALLEAAPDLAPVADRLRGAPMAQPQPEPAPPEDGEPTPLPQ